MTKKIPKRCDVIIEESTTKILRALNIDCDTENFKETPQRVARMFLELTQGMRNPEDIKQLLSKTFPSNYDEMIVVRDIEAHSLCPHHLLPVKYVISFAYLPDQKVLGISKIPRFIQLLAKQPIMQEDLTGMICKLFNENVLPNGSACLVRGVHSCMTVRGVRANSEVVTSCLTGYFYDKTEAKQEFMDLVNKNGK